MNELRRGKKINHYIWWIFPTTEPGRADEFETRVTNYTYTQFIENIDTSKWEEVLTIFANSTFKIPSVDEGRVRYFCCFWEKMYEQERVSRNFFLVTHIPWLPRIIDTLEKKMVE